METFSDYVEQYVFEFIKSDKENAKISEISTMSNATVVVAIWFTTLIGNAFAIKPSVDIIL